jgi:hypothetical protein
MKRERELGWDGYALASQNQIRKDRSLLNCS